AGSRRATFDTRTGTFCSRPTRRGSSPERIPIGAASLQGTPIAPLRTIERRCASRHPRLEVSMGDARMRKLAFVEVDDLERVSGGLVPVNPTLNQIPWASTPEEAAQLLEERTPGRSVEEIIPNWDEPRGPVYYDPQEMVDHDNDRLTQQENGEPTFI